MARRVKIKRYNRIYRRSRFSAWKAAGVLAALCVAVFLGASLYQPVRDFVTGKLPMDQTESGPLQASQPDPEGPSVPAPEPASEPEPPAAPDPASLRAVYIPQNVLAGGDAVSFVENAGIADANAAVIDLKDESGRVLYQTRVDMAHDAGAVVEGAVRLEGAVSALKGAGYAVIGRICAFRDPLAPYAGDRIAAVKYQNTQLTWLDALAEDGGKPWLNPYAPAAQSYVADMALEAVSQGVDIVMLDCVQFPEGQGLRMATYGDWPDGTERDEALSQFVGSVREQVAQRGGGLFCAVGAADLLSGDFEKYGGVHPAALYGSVLGVRAMPADFGAQFEGEGFSLLDPVKSPYETVRSVLRILGTDTPGVSTLIPLLQGYTDESLAADDNQAYSADEIAAQIRAVEESGLQSYIVCFEEP